MFDKNKMQNKKEELDESTDKFSKLEGCSTFFKESALELFYIIYYNVSRYSDYFNSNMAYFNYSVQILGYIVLSLVNQVYA